MNEQEHLEALADIKNLMERSSRFLSLSGMSGIFIGFYALAGAMASWWYLGHNTILVTSYDDLVSSADAERSRLLLTFFIGTASLLLFLSLLTAYLLTQRLAKKHGLKIWDTSAKRMLINLMIPLLTGGVYCLILLQQDRMGLVAPSMLIFYGLALLNAGKYTYNDIRYLGIIEIILGLIASMSVGYGLLFWALGFGVMHIIYGITMYYKYER